MENRNGLVVNTRLTRGAKKAFERVNRTPTKDVELLRNLESKRLNDSRRRLYSQLPVSESDQTLSS